MVRLINGLKGEYTPGSAKKDDFREFSSGSLDK